MTPLEKLQQRLIKVQNIATDKKLVLWDYVFALLEIELQNERQTL